MSLIGIRDMRCWKKRRTTVCRSRRMSWNITMRWVREEAIERECARQGQVYYVYNRVEDIDEVAGHMQKLVPDLTVAYAHGQMGNTNWNGLCMISLMVRIDVLVSTTIIETGLDISNANTMIIHDADRLGLHSFISCVWACRTL